MQEKVILVNVFGGGDALVAIFNKEIQQMSKVSEER
jgi:hypothetical protein